MTKARENMTEGTEYLKEDVRRLPVIDGTKLIGMVSQADIARACAPEKVGELVGAISQD